MKASKVKFAIFAYLTGVVAIYAAVFWNLRGEIRNGYSDFTIYYCAGTVIRHGMGNRLYDEPTQFKFQREFAPDVATRLGALPFNHPPFEALFFVPLTYAPYPWAFALWDLANLSMLVSLMFLLRPHLLQLQNYPGPLWVLISLSFFPIFAALLQGQDAILLLFLYAVTFVHLKKNQDVFAGGCLAVGIFKPHLVLPFVFLLLVQGRKRILYGFLPIAALLAIVSTAIVGGEGILLYARYVVYLESTLARGAIVPSDMPNLRGMLEFFRLDVPHIFTLILIISVGLLFFAALQSRKAGRNLIDLKFSLAATATVLVSYHAMVYDLSLLMVPVFLQVNQLLGENKLRGYRNMLIITTLATFFIAPLQLVLYMRAHWAALLGFAIFLWFLVDASEISSRSGKTADYTTQKRLGSDPAISTGEK